MMLLDATAPSAKPVYSEKTAASDFFSKYESAPSKSELEALIDAGENDPCNYETASGVVEYGYRYYNSVTGRWLNRDPIEEQGGLNLYGMVRNDPVNFWDYLGLLTDSPYSSGNVTPEGGNFSRNSTGGEANGINGYKDGCPCFSGRYDRELQSLWLARKRKEADEWNEHFREYGSLISQISNGYKYAPHPRNWRPTPPSLNGPSNKAYYWKVDGTWLRNTIESMQASVISSSGGNYQADDIIDDPTAGKNMSPRQSAKASGSIYLAKLAMHLLATKDQYIIGQSTSGDGYFVSSTYRGGQYIGNRSLYERYESKMVGRLIIDDIINGYESLENPFEALIEKCSKKWGR